MPAEEKQYRFFREVLQIISPLDHPFVSPVFVATLSA